MKHLALITACLILGAQAGYVYEKPARNGLSEESPQQQLGDVLANYVADGSKLKARNDCSSKCCKFSSFQNF